MMPKFRIERTEMVTRVWLIDAPDEDTALDNYMEEDDIEEYEYHSGQPDVRITEEIAEENPREKGDDDGVEYADPRDYKNGWE